MFWGENRIIVSDLLLFVLFAWKTFHAYSGA